MATGVSLGFWQALGIARTLFCRLDESAFFCVRCTDNSGFVNVAIFEQDGSTKPAPNGVRPVRPLAASQKVPCQARLWSPLDASIQQIDEKMLSQTFGE